jgi:hypothetical protein
MAADAGQGTAALRHLGRGVVRTTGAEIGNALNGPGPGGQRLFLFDQEAQPLLDAFARMEARDPLGDGPGNARRR